MEYYNTNENKKLFSLCSNVLAFLILRSNMQKRTSIVYSQVIEIKP